MKDRAPRKTRNKMTKAIIKKKSSNSIKPVKKEPESDVSSDEVDGRSPLLVKFVSKLKDPLKRK